MYKNAEQYHGNVFEKDINLTMLALAMSRTDWVL